jgi:hypothetical protein
MGWQPFDLDHRALQLVLRARDRDRDSLNQAYKMRTACAYGMERFWGEHLRLSRNNNEIKKADFVKETWTEFIEIMKKSRPDLSIPEVVITERHTEQEMIKTVKAEADKFWLIPTSDQQECLTVLVALCDAIVWWTQRLKIKSGAKQSQPGHDADGAEDSELMTEN